MSIAPLALTLALLVFWSGLGWALIAIVDPEIEPSTSFLVAPVCGIAATLLPVFWLNAYGIAVADIARPLVAVLVLFTLGGWVVRRPRWRVSDLALALPVLLGVAITGFPTLSFGYDWIGNANDDWANYNLSAMRDLAGGFYQRPSLEALKGGLDYPGYLWFLEVAADARPGSDLVLAWLAGLTGRNPFLIFMPLILAFQAALSLATAAVAVRSVGRGPVLWAGVTLAAFAPLGLYAVHQQLIAQVLGLAFMCGLTALTFVPVRDLTTSRRLVLVTVVTAAYAIAYPETVPFFGLAFVLFHLTHVRDREWGWSRVWRLAFLGVALACLLGPYAISFGYYLLAQFQQSSGQGSYNGVSLFPYFLVPSGVAVLFGLVPLAADQNGLVLSIEIGVAFALVLGVLVATVRGLRRRSAIAVYLVVIDLVCCLLIRSRNDFGLFKLAMFVQPFLWFGLAVLMVGIARRWAWIPVVLLGCALVSTDVRYVRAALDEEVGRANPLPGASSARLLSRLLANDGRNCGIDVGTALPPLAKILGAVPGCARVFEARAMPLFSVPKRISGAVDHNILHRINGVGEFTRVAANEVARPEDSLSFRRMDGTTIDVTASRAPIEYADHLHLASFEGVIDSNGLPSDLEMRRDRRNSISFINSTLGADYYLPDAKSVALYGEERDFYYPRNVTAALGRYLLFRVHDPSARVRMQLDLTTTVLGDMTRMLPPAVAMGETAVPLGLVGHGSARVLSPAFAPLVVDGIAYVLLDLGSDPIFLKTPRTGLMRLYGTEVALDYRSLVAFARQIRLVDADAGPDEAAPARVETLPQDLADPHLQYSGLYEDGWMGDDGFFVLHSARPGVAVLRGEVPAGIGIDTVDLDVTVGDAAPVRKSLRTGPFVVEVPAAAGMSRIAFHFGRIGRLGTGDDRPVSARFRAIAIEDDETTGSEGVPGATDALPAVLNGIGRHAEGIFPDGWMTQAGFLEVRSPHDGDVVLKGVVPGELGLEGETLTLRIGSAPPVRTAVLPSGAFEVRVPMKSGPSELAFAFDRSAVLPGGDGRRVAAQLTAMEVATAATAPVVPPSAGPKGDGISADGWMAPTGTLEVEAERDGDAVVAGLVPGGLGLERQVLTLREGGARPASYTLPPGPFVARVPVKAGRTTLAFSFATSATLPGADGRRIGAKLDAVSIEPDHQPRAILQQIGPQSTGVFPDGWMAADGVIEVRTDDDGEAVLKGLVPQGLGLEGQTLTIQGADAGARSVSPLSAGDFEVRVRVKAGQNRLAYSFEKAGVLPDPDGRHAAARLTSVSIEPAR